MNYAAVAEKLGEDFADQPIEYGAEADLRVRLYRFLTEELEQNGGVRAEVQKPNILGETPSYKRAYKEMVEQRLRQRGSIRRVRLDVSVEKRRKYDLVCFDQDIQSPIDWIRSGSKRFSETDLDAVFGLKFIKNKCYPPLRCSITDDRILEMELSELQSEFNEKENSIGRDLDELNSLPSDTTAIFILVSNNNYLFLKPLSEEEHAERKKKQAGLAARNWLQDAVDGVGILYVHPGGITWINPLSS
ncbi:hypothetical protein BRC96_01025 [Halobacteriales archaeon QS_6_64_34]|nr:MAG: hypothetical protein BRC96_01025 [Halobacteriales archaeon QS_6_64_34]